MNKPSFIYLTAFCCGAANMAVELTSVRFLAPYLGASMQTWAIVIVVTLVSMSAGNWIGGQRADMGQPEKILSRQIFRSALWITAIPLVGRYLVMLVLPLVLLMFPNHFLPLATTVLSLVIFAFPCYALGMVTPCLVKLSLDSMEKTGTLTGRIYAISTVGSIFGTLFPTFLAIPVIGTCKTFLLTALVLMGLSAWISFRRGTRISVAGPAALVIGLFLFGPVSFSFAFWNNALVEDESAYQYLQVARDQKNTYLSTHVIVGRQSAYFSGSELSNEYWGKALLGFHFLPEPAAEEARKVLMIGFGAGTFAKLCRTHFPGTTIDGVEIDGKIIDLAKKHFALDERDATIFVEDGRTFLMRHPENQYDVIFLDAYRDINIPFHLTSREFFERAKKSLKPHGIMLLNVNMRAPHEADLAGYLGQTLKTVLKRVYRYNIPGSPNTFVLASDNEACFDLFLEAGRRMKPENPLFPFLLEWKDNAREVKETNLLLTDDWAPIEMFEQEMQEALLKDAFREILVRCIAAFRALYS